MKKILMLVILVVALGFWQPQVARAEMGADISVSKIKISNDKVVVLIIGSMTGYDDMGVTKSAHIKYVNGYWTISVLVNKTKFTKADLDRIIMLLPNPWREGRHGEMLATIDSL